LVVSQYIDIFQLFYRLILTLSSFVELYLFIFVAAN